MTTGRPDRAAPAKYSRHESLAMACRMIGAKQGTGWKIPKLEKRSAHG